MIIDSYVYIYIYIHIYICDRTNLLSTISNERTKVGESEMRGNYERLTRNCAVSNTFCKLMCRRWQPIKEYSYLFTSGFAQSKHLRRHLNRILSRHNPSTL